MMSCLFRRSLNSLAYCDKISSNGEGSYPMPAPLRFHHSVRFRCLLSYTKRGHFRPKKMGEVENIDISSFLCKSEVKEDAKADILAQWNTSFKKLGFVSITGHGVPEEIVEQLRLDAREFFTQKLVEKLKSCLHQGYGKGGYVPMGIESVARSLSTEDGKTSEDKPTDYVENICFHFGAEEGDIVPEHPASLRKSVQKYWHHMKMLLSTIMEISALSLGLPKEYFAPFFEKPDIFLRLAYYPAQNENAPSLNQMRYGAHTDYQGFTILKQDDEVGGLEVFLDEKETWIPVSIIKNSFVVNAGDLIQRWTNDHWKSSLHRVINPSAGDSHKDRLSLVFFTGPNPNCTVSPLDKFCDKDNPLKYEPILAGVHLLEKISKTSTSNK